jgi:predicted type IV restriction endonuclease
VTRLREFLHQAKSISEASTRAFFIDRYLDALGYTNFDDIEHGSAVQSGDYPDYVLRSAGKPVMAVEAKKIGQPLGPKESSQLVKYCSVLGLRWGVLTDGRYIQIYDAPLTGVAPEDRLVLEIDLNDWADREDFDVRRWPEAALITKQAMEDGEGLERFAARELIRSILVESGSKTLKALRVELQAKKVLLREAEIAELIRELLT